MSQQNIHKLSFAGLLVTLGIIFGDIGTSPLYVMKAIAGEEPISREIILGAISCVFWTLTLQTTIKYVFLTLQADNHGEGGIFSLYSLVRRTKKWLIWVAVIGGAMLLADGIITPPISVSSAVEGLHEQFPDINTVWVTTGIITIIFLFQPFGTSVVGRSFGPVMFVWFTMLAVLGSAQIVHAPEVMSALSPHHAVQLLVNHPGGFWLLGAVFLCTTGAEALYSDLGHCGRANIRVSWIFVKVSLLLNYLGQGAWLIGQEGEKLGGRNPFYEVMPEWFKIVGITIATLATIIASQALISGSFTLVSEAIRLSLMPRMKVNYPSDAKGQLFIPTVNFFLWLGCVFIVWYFKTSSNMEAAYGLAITITMLMTTLLLAFYLRVKRYPVPLILLTLFVFLSVELSFLAANLLKFMHGGYITLVVAGFIFLLMYIWHRAHIIKGRLTEMVKIREYLPQLIALSHDQSLPKYATNLVFLSTAALDDEVEQKILYSILQKQPKRADVYWFVHIQVTDDPYTQEYSVIRLAEDDVYRVTFYLGFRVQQRVNLFLRKVVEEMVEKGEVNVVSRYHSLRENNVAGDFKFIILEESLSYENQLPFTEEFVMSAQIFVKHFTASPERWFGLDTSLVSVEKVPLVIQPATGIGLKRRVSA